MYPWSAACSIPIFKDDLLQGNSKQNPDRVLLIRLSTTHDPIGRARLLFPLSPFSLSLSIAACQNWSTKKRSRQHMPSPTLHIIVPKHFVSLQQATRVERFSAVVAHWTGTVDWRPGVSDGIRDGFRGRLSRLTVLMKYLSLCRWGPFWISAHGRSGDWDCR